MLNKFLKLIRVCYYIKEMYDELYCECDDVEWIIKLITPYVNTSKYSEMVNKSLTSKEYFKILDVIWDDMGELMYDMRVNELKEFETVKITQLYKLFLKISDLMSVCEFESLSEISIYLFDNLSSTQIKNEFYYEMESGELICESYDIKKGESLCNLCIKYINDDLKRYGVIL